MVFESSNGSTPSYESGWTSTRIIYKTIRGCSFTFLDLAKVKVWGSSSLSPPLTKNKKWRGEPVINLHVILRHNGFALTNLKHHSHEDHEVVTKYSQVSRLLLQLVFCCVAMFELSHCRGFISGREGWWALSGCMTTESADYCMLVNEWAWSRSRVCLLRLEVDLGSVLES